MARRTQTNSILNKLIRFLFLLIMIRTLKKMFQSAKAESNITTRKYFRQLTPELGDNEKFKCKVLPTNVTDCECLAPCMFHLKNTDYCGLKKCQTYDVDLGECKPAGQSWLTALLVHILATTFGSSIYLGMWKWFAVVMGIIFGPCVLRMFFGCFAYEEDTIENLDIMMRKLYILGFMAYFVIWFYIGILIITNDVLGKDGCSLVK